MNKTSKLHKVSICILTVSALMAILTTGCIFQKPSSATGTVTDVVMSKSVDSNSRPVDPTDVFSTDAAGFYCSFMVSGFPVGAAVEVKWIYVGGDPVAEGTTGKNAVIETQKGTLTKGKGYTYTVYYHPGIPEYRWPVGDYKVEISVDGIDKASATFQVQE